MRISEVALDSLKLAKDADHAESYAVMSETHAAYIDGGRISNIETKIDSGMCFRVSCKNRLGRASVTLNSENSAEACVDSAMRVSSFSPKNNGFKGYPMPSKPVLKVNGIYDRKIEDITGADLKDVLNAVIGSCGSVIQRGLLRVSAISSVTANTNGLFTEHRGTMMYGHFTSMFRGKRNGEGTETIHGVSFDIDTERIGGELHRKAKASSSSSSFKGNEKLTMILPPCELGDMIMSSAGSALNGENVLYKRSPWTDRIGEKVASEILTVTDDPAVPGPLCSEFDDEGTPSQRKVLIENGILRSFIRDSFAGESTGNGMRRNSTDSQGIYNSAVSIKPMNMIVSPGRCTIEEIISQTKNGIFVEKFAWPEADPLTGRFGLEVRCGHIIRNGRIRETINNALLMGSMFDALRNIEHISDEQENMGCVTVPAMSFSGIELTGN